MKRLLVRFLTWAAIRSIYFSSLLLKLSVVPSLFRFWSMTADKNLDYKNNYFVSFEDSPPLINDLPFSFFVRVILEGDYRTVVEVGSYDGRRIFNLKKLFEHIRAYGLDIHKSYINPQNINDVNLQYFNMDFFRSEKFDKPLLVSAHTFQYMGTEELSEFLKLLFEQKYDIAFSVHASPFARQNTLRRSHKSYYHPYEKILRDIGYTVNSEQFRHNLSSSYIERLYYYYATCA